MTSAGSSPISSASGAPAASRSPWLWVPSLYFSQGIPYVIVMTLSVVMYKRLGISNTDIALYTSWLYLPWVLKPLWSPAVDLTRTKRFWVVSMQFLIALGLAWAGLAIRGPAFFRASLVLFWVMAFCSATHDIAADGFYMLGLSHHQQAWWVGLRSTFYRTAMVVGSGLLVVLAGTLESRNGLEPRTVEVRTQSLDAQHAEIPSVTNFIAALTFPEPRSNADGTRILLNSPALEIPVIFSRSLNTAPVVEEAHRWNQNHGFLGNSAPPVAPAESASGATRFLRPLAQAWRGWVSKPLAGFLSAHFARERVEPHSDRGNLGLLAVRLSAPPHETVVVTWERQKRVAEYFGLAKGEHGLELVEGERLVFNATNWDQPALAVVQLDLKLKDQTHARFTARSGNIPLAWSVTLLVVAGLFLAFSFWHALILPRPAADGPVRSQRSWAGEFLATLGSFFSKPGAPLAVLFILLYRFDEAQLVKVLTPFLLDGREQGGLALNTSQVGLVYGTFGILALTCGGLAGGFSAARYGLKRMLPIMVGSMYLPKLAFIFLAWAQPENFLVPCGAIALEQFGYGFGFTAFMLYLLYFSNGPHRTAHYALCTGLMALGMMIPGLWSGWLADLIGYRHFFVWVIFSALPGLGLALTLRIDPQFGKKMRA